MWFMILGWTERSLSTYEYQMLFLFMAMGVACKKPRRISRRIERLEQET